MTLLMLSLVNFITPFIRVSKEVDAIVSEVQVGIFTLIFFAIFIDVLYHLRFIKINIDNFISLLTSLLTVFGTWLFMSLFFLFQSVTVQEYYNTMYVLIFLLIVFVILALVRMTACRYRFTKQSVDEPKYGQSRFG